MAIRLYSYLQNKSLTITGLVINTIIKQRTKILLKKKDRYIEIHENMHLFIIRDRIDVAPSLIIRYKNFQGSSITRH